MSDRGRLVAVAVVGALAVFVVGLVGLLGRSGPATSPLPRADRVLIVSVPGLQWRDLAGTETPALDGLLGAVALGSVRAVGDETTLAEAYLTIGAGDRVEDVDDPNGAVPGALGDALRSAGRTTAVFGGTEAVAALADRDGIVDRTGTVVDADLGAAVTLVEFAGLSDASTAVDRAAVLADLDRWLAELTVPDSTAVLVVVPIAPASRNEVVVFSAGPSVSSSPTATEPGDGTRLAASATTRRAGTVTLADIAPTVLALVGVPEPDEMRGTPVRIVDGNHGRPASVADQVDHLADRSARVHLRDRAVGPVSVVLVVLIVLCAFAALGRQGRTARGLAAITATYPTVTFLTGTVAYHRLPLPFVVTAIVFVSVVVAALVVSSTASRGRAVPVALLIGALWAVLVVDIVTGGRLQIDTPLGYTPTVAGRFQGYGNLAFGLVAASALALASIAVTRRTITRRTGGGPSVLPRAGTTTGTVPVMTVPVATVPVMTVLSTTVLAITVLAVGLPALGSDVGGTLALVPAAIVLFAAITGRRVGWRRAVIAAGAAIGAVVALALVDRARPPDARTHLGRFADDLLSGEGGDLLRRKIQANWDILTATIWPSVLLVVTVVLAVLARRRRDELGELFAPHPGAVAFARSFGVLAVAGMALNDSGIAVPAIMLAVAIPWVVAVVVTPVLREGRT